MLLLILRLGPLGWHCLEMLAQLFNLLFQPFFFFLNGHCYLAIVAKALFKWFAKYLGKMHKKKPYYFSLVVRLNLVVLKEKTLISKLNL